MIPHPLLASYWVTTVNVIKSNILFLKPRNERHLVRAGWFCYFFTPERLLGAGTGPSPELLLPHSGRPTATARPGVPGPRPEWLGPQEVISKSYL